MSHHIMDDMETLFASGLKSALWRSSPLEKFQSCAFAGTKIVNTTPLATNMDARPRNTIRHVSKVL